MSKEASTKRHVHLGATYRLSVGEGCPECEFVNDGIEETSTSYDVTCQGDYYDRMDSINPIYQEMEKEEDE